MKGENLQMTYLVHRKLKCFKNNNNVNHCFINLPFRMSDEERELTLLSDALTHKHSPHAVETLNHQSETPSCIKEKIKWMNAWKGEMMNSFGWWV